MGDTPQEVYISASPADCLAVLHNQIAMMGPIFSWWIKVDAKYMVVFRDYHGLPDSSVLFELVI